MNKNLILISIANALVVKRMNKEILDEGEGGTTLKTVLGSGQKAIPVMFTAAIRA